MPALNGRFNARNNTQDATPARSLTDHLTFSNLMTVVMGLLAVKERWDAHKDRQIEREYQRIRRTDPFQDAAGELANPPQYRDDPNAEDIGLDRARLQGEDELPPRPRRSKRSCCVCCGVRCDIVFKALGIVLALYFAYSVYKIVRWVFTPSPTGLEDMPAYSTSLGCSDVPYVYSGKQYDVSASSASISLDLAGGAVGTVFLTHSDTANAIIEMDLRTNEEPLLQKVTTALSENSTAQHSAFRLATPSSASSSDGCMRFDLTVQIPSSLRTLSFKSQSLVHVKYDEHATLTLSDLSIDLLSPLPDNLLLPHEQLSAERSMLSMRGGYLVGSLAFVRQAEISTRRGSAVTKVDVTPLPAPDLDSPARLVTSTGAGRADIKYVNPDRRMIASEHTSTGGDMYLTYKEAGYNGRVSVQARSRTSTGLEGTMLGSPSQGGAKELPWVGDKNGTDTMKIKTSGWVGLYF